MARVAVIGGGIVGASAAYHLARAGWRRSWSTGRMPGTQRRLEPGLFPRVRARRHLLRTSPWRRLRLATIRNWWLRLADVGETDSRFEVVGELIWREPRPSSRRSRLKRPGWLSAEPVACPILAR
jgi:glycine/D-amino acid oxidase-like deaminating enzyme